MTIDEAIEVLESWRRLSYHNDDGTDDDSHELLLALDVVIPIVRGKLDMNDFLKTKIRSLICGDGYDAEARLNEIMRVIDNIYNNAELKGNEQ